MLFKQFQKDLFRSNSSLVFFFFLVWSFVFNYLLHFRNTQQINKNLFKFWIHKDMRIKIPQQFSSPWDLTMKNNPNK